MREAALQSILLAKAVEEADPEGRRWPLAERERATEQALAAAGGAVAATGVQAGEVLADRADRLLRASSLSAAIGPRLARLSPWPGGVTALLMVSSFVAGVGLATLDGSRRINILAFPALGLILWNLAVYVGLLLLWLRGRVTAQQPMALHAPFWLESWLQKRLARVLSTALADLSPTRGWPPRFAADWIAVQREAAGQRFRRSVHLAAAAVGIGLIAGLYWRGIGLRFVAGWESTWFDARQVATLLQFLYGPLAALSGRTLPQSVEEIDRLRWAAQGEGGGDAAPWIHLIALGVCTVVVLPRLALAAWSSWRLRRMVADSLLPAPLLDYARRILPEPPTLPLHGVVRVQPYGFDPATSSTCDLERWVRECCGPRATLELRRPIPYGGDPLIGVAGDRGLASSADAPAALVLLFNLAATPESETHGAFIDTRRSALREFPTQRLLLAVDESAWEARFGADPSLASRTEQRRELWRSFIASHGGEAQFIGSGSAAGS